MTPLIQTELFGMNKYFNEIISLYNKEKLPNKILLSGIKGIGKSTLAYHIINYILSQNEDNKYDINNFKINYENKSFKLLRNNSHPNFHLIDLLKEKKNIEINQIREMINYHNKSSFSDMPKFILIDNVENLNKNSTNALLKILEEPNENTFFILVYDNSKNILSTLKSRCLTFKINLSFNEIEKITNLFFNKDIRSLINKELTFKYNSQGNIIRLINFANEKKIDLLKYSLKDFLFLLIENSYYKKNRFIKDLVISYIELYFFNLLKNAKNKELIFKSYNYFIEKINNTHKFNLDEESLFMEFKSKVLNG